MLENYQKVSRLLTYLEKRSQTNIRKLTKQWSWLVVAKLVGTALALFLATVYARYLTQEAYGTYKYVLSFFDLLAIFTLQGMGDASQRAIAKKMDASFWTTFKLRILFGSLTTLSSIGIGAYYLTQGNHLLGFIFIASAPFIVAINVSSHYNSLLMGRQLFKQISINNTLIQICTTTVIVVAVIFTQDLYWLVGAFLFSGFFFASISFARIVKKYPLNNEVDDTALTYGKHMSILGIVSIATNQAAPFLLWHFLGPVQLAIYSFSLAAVAQMRTLFKLLTTSMAFSKLAKLDIHTLKTTLPRKILLAHLVTIPAAVLLTLIIPPIYHLLFPTYTESILYAQVMTLLLAFSPMRLYSTALMTHGSPKAIHTYSIISSSLLLGAMVAFIPLFGIWGVIIATAVTQVVTNSITVFFFKRM